MVTTSPEPATLPRESYLNSEYGLKSWQLTQDHKRIALLYLFATTFFFVIGGVAASLIRLELLTPAGDLVASDTYNKLFYIHGVLLSSTSSTSRAGEFSYTAHDRCTRRRLPQTQSRKLVSLRNRRLF